jgi:hypothetical protein
MFYNCFIDTNIQKKAVLGGYDLKAVFEVPMYHMSHKNHLPQGGDVNNLHQVAETKTPKYNDPWDWVENFTTSQNSDDWGLGNIEIEFETI